MSEFHENWTAILTLYEDSRSSSYQQKPEHYILSTKELTYIGRAIDCQIVLRPEYSTASRYHAKVELINLNGQSAWQIWDLETPNGTYVNDKRIDHCQRLTSGDKLRLGKTKGAKFIFECKLLDVKQLAQLQKQDHPYDQTILLDIYDEDLTEFRFDHSHKSSPEKSLIDLGSPVLLSVPEQPLTPAQDIGKRRSYTDVLNRLSPNPLLRWIFLGFILSFLTYGIKTAFEVNNRRDEVLRSYINNISSLLLYQNLDSLNPSDQDGQIARAAANGQTRITLIRLDARSKGFLVRFLYESNLIKLQPSKLKEEWEWLSKTDRVLYNAPMKLFGKDAQRKELVYFGQLTLSPFLPLTSPILLIKGSEFNQRRSDIKKNKCDISTQNKNFKPNCAWVVAFDLQASEEPFVTPIQLSGANITGIVLKDAPLENINLEGAYLSFQECTSSSSGNLLDHISRRWESWFSQNGCRADLSNAGLQRARLFRSVLRGANLSNAKLDYADLRQADLRGADLRGVQWKNAVLKGACYSKENWQQNFPKAGPDGGTFNPIAEGMKPVLTQNSNSGHAKAFQECKDIEG